MKQKCSTAQGIKAPKLRCNKSSNQGFVQLNGKRHYLGVWGKPETEERYRRTIALWLDNGQALPPDPEDLTVIELIFEHWRHCESYYRRADGGRTGELDATRKALQPVKELYGSTPAKDFSPKCIKTVRNAMIDKGWTRRNINKQVSRVKRMFRWAVSEELVPGNVYHALQAVDGLRYGRSGAKESQPVKPVPAADVEAVLLHLGRHVAAMVQLQRLSGMRPGEVCAMRPCDIDPAREVWIYRPPHHKTAHHGHERRIYLNATAQRILKPFLLRDSETHCFSPLEAEAERREEQHAQRITPLSCGNRPGTNIKDNPGWAPGDCYTTQSYGRAIARACVQAGVEHWTPHRLRHSFATDVRASLGLDNAQVLLGHAKCDVTQVYAAANEARAIDAIKRLG